LGWTFWEPRGAERACFSENGWGEKKRRKEDETVINHPLAHIIESNKEERSESMGRGRVIKDEGRREGKNSPQAIKKKKEEGEQKVVRNKKNDPITPEQLEKAKYWRFATRGRCRKKLAHQIRGGRETASGKKARVVVDAQGN